MKKFFLLLLLAALPSFADPAQTMSGTLTVAASDCLSGAAHSCVALGLSSGAGAATVQVSGTYTGTLQFEMTNDPAGCGAAATTFVNVSASPLPSGTAVSSTTSTGTWRVNAAGGTCLHVRASALASGTAVVAMSYGTGSASAGAGGGAPVSFDAIVGGTNTGAAMVVGTGASLAASGSGTIAATSLAGLTGTLNQVPKGNGSGGLADSTGLSESYPTFTVNESQTTNGTQSVVGDIQTTALTAPSSLACVQGATTGGFLLHNQAYFYKVTAISANGQTVPSNESTFTTAVSPVPDTYTASCTWTGHTGDTGYKLYRSTGSGTELQLATITPGNVNSYTDNTNTTPSGAMPTANSTGMVTVAGKVGIGVTPPVNDLDVVDAAVATIGVAGTSGAVKVSSSAAAGNRTLQLLDTSAAKHSWLIGANYNVGDSLEITPSTALGGTTFSLPAITLDSNGAATLAATPRTSGVASYFTLTIPADTAQTASTESIGFKTVTGTRTWATTGTVALQRENFFAGPTYASASASQTFTDVFNSYFTPPIQGTNAIFTRNHTLGIVDPTSAASSITGGLVVATTLGTAATSVGIGGGNVNAGGNGTFGGTLAATGHTTFEGVTSTGATGSGKLVYDTGPTLSALAFSGSAPAVTTSGTTPYLNMNTLVKGTLNTCTFNFSTSSFTLAASPLSMCSPVYTLPNAALTWYYTCSFTWSVTAGTTPTLTFGQTFGQAPSAANEWQNIFTSNAGVSIQASQAVTSNSSMTATGSLTTSATLFQATIGGTFTASATSGTFSPTATLTGTNAVGTLRGGCVIQ